MGPVHPIFFQWYRVDNLEMCLVLSDVSNMHEHFGVNAGAGVTRLAWIFTAGKLIMFGQFLFAYDLPGFKSTGCG